MGAGTRAEPRGLRASDYDYRLPPERIARYPAPRRDESRLAIVDRARGALRHGVFRDLVRLVEPGDLLVLNESRVFPARLRGRKPTGAPAEILLLRPLARPGAPPGTVWEALVRPGGKLKPGRRVVVADDLEVEIVDSAEGGGRVVRLHTGRPPEEALDLHGRIPLPPYLGREEEPVDRERYQTVYAREPGSVAAPTAGLHFTPELLEEIRERGAGLARIVLHVGIGTFRPVDEEALEEHRMHGEWYRIPPGAAEAVNRTRGAGGRVWAVGTTVVRVLETAADEGGRVRPGEGWTDLFIRPPYRFRAVDRLVTNFHLPRSTLLMLVAAFAGYDLTMRAYREAIRLGYRFYSYGDAMVIL